MNVLKILETVMDGPHLRTSIYFSGCTHHCKECHNPETWKFGQGTQYTPLELLEEVEKYGNKYVTLSGGDPLEQKYLIGKIVFTSFVFSIFVIKYVVFYHLIPQVYLDSIYL